MKKQLLAAAVAATMTPAAFADISITGAGKVNYTMTDYDLGTAEDTDVIAQDFDIGIKGTNGDTTVVINLGAIDSTGTDDIAVEDNYLSTKLGDVSVKVGAWDNGNNHLRASSRADGKASVSTTVQDLTITYDAANNADESVKLNGTIAGVDLMFKQKQAGEDYSLKTTVGGVTLDYLFIGSDTANSDASSIEVSTNINGVGLKMAKATADSAQTLEGDTWLGDFEGNATTSAYGLSAGQDIFGVNASFAYAGNTIQLRRTEVDGVAGENTDITKVVLTRPLANGTTFEAIYADINDAGSTTTDAQSLDLELAVKF